MKIGYRVKQSTGNVGGRRASCLQATQTPTLLPYAGRIVLIPLRDEFTLLGGTSGRYQSQGPQAFLWSRFE